MSVRLTSVSEYLRIRVASSQCRPHSLGQVAREGDAALVTEVNATDEQADGLAQQRCGVVDTNHGAALAWVVDVLWQRRRGVGQDKRDTWRGWQI